MSTESAYCQVDSLDKLGAEAYRLLPFYFIIFDMPSQCPQTTPPLTVTLLELRRALNRLAKQFEWDSEMLSTIAECQALLKEAFRSARTLIMLTA